MRTKLTNPMDREWDRFPRLFSLWFAFCAVLALATLCGLGWLLFAVVDYLQRH